MIRANNPTRLHQKRTIRPLYGWHSAVPYACFLDTAATGSTVVYPGQVALKTTGEQMRPHTGAANLPAFGLFNNFINGQMDELMGGTEIGVWVGGRDAVFEILAGPTAGESPLAASDFLGQNATVGGAPIYSDAAGRLTLAPGTSLRVAHLIEAVSARKIVVQLVLAVA
jgi:hypothetical protein